MIAPRSLGWRLAASMFAAAAAIAIVLTLYYQRRTHALLSREADERLATLVQHVAAASVLGTLAHSEELLGGPLAGAMSQSDVVTVAIYDRAGSLIAARGRAGITPPAWQHGLTGCRPCTLGGGRLRWVASVTSPSSEHPTQEAGFYDGPPPSASGGENAPGWVLLDVTTAARAAAERRITTSGLLIAAGVLLLALVVTLLIARGLTSQLRALARATREIAKGRWDVPLPAASTTEVAQLADAFRAMTDELAENREHLEEKVASRTRELEAANQAKDQFVATVSHDFRSPLAIILSSVQTVLADREMREEVRRQFLERAERQCKRLGALVSDLLDLARIENRDAVFERVSLSDVVEEILDGVRAAAEERRVALVYSPPEAPVVAEVDRGLVCRALANLVDNALKFTPASGRVTVTLRQMDGEARSAVSDTGPGIPEDERAHVFERFFQGRQAQALGRGSGLGLAIVAGIARRHGGTVEVSSERGVGSTFELRLPLRRR